MSSSEISPKGSTAGKTPDALRAEELTLDLKLKNADNNFLQDELNKARLQIEKKDKILAVLTEGLKEVSVQIKSVMMVYNASFFFNTSG